MRIIRHPAILVFIALAVAPAVLFGINGPWFGGGAGPILRPPSSFPQRLTPETFRRVSAWFNDRLGMRYPLMVLDSHWRLNVWRLRFRGDVLFGHASWLFFNDSPPAPAAHLADFRGTLRMTESTIATIDRQIASARAAFGACGKAALSWSRRTSRAFIRRNCARMGRISRAGWMISWRGCHRRRAPPSSIRVPNCARASRVTVSRSIIRRIRTGTILVRLSRTRRSSRLLQRPIGSIGRNWRRLRESRYTPKPRPAATLPPGCCICPGIFPIRTSCCVGWSQLPLSVRAERDRVVVSNRQGRGKLLILADLFGPPLASLLGRHFAEVEMLSRPTWPALFDGALVASANADVAIIEIAERSLPELVQAPARLDQMCR